MDLFHPLEVVVCGSETQIQKGENFNYLVVLKSFKASNCAHFRRVINKEE